MSSDANHRPKEFPRSCSCEGQRALVKALDRLVAPLDQILVSLHRTANLQRIIVLMTGFAVALLVGTAYSQRNLFERLANMESQVEQILQTAKTTERRAEQIGRKVETQAEVKLVAPANGSGGPPGAVLVIEDETPLPDVPRTSEVHLSSEAPAPRRVELPIALPTEGFGP